MTLCVGVWVDDLPGERLGPAVGDRIAFDMTA